MKSRWSTAVVVLVTTALFALPACSGAEDVATSTDPPPSTPGSTSLAPSTATTGLPTGPATEPSESTPSTASTPTTAPPTTTPPTVTVAPPPPRVGTCHATGKAAFQQLRDASPAVSCARRHTAETFAVFDVGRSPSQREIDAIRRTCQSRFTSYVGDSATVSTLGLTVLLPAAREVADGAAWARCDVIEQPNYNGRGGVPRTGSVRGVLDEAVPDRFRGCARHWPKVSQPVHFTSCARPHQAELIPESLNLGGPGAAFPGAATAESRSKQFCLHNFQQYVPETVNYYYYYPTRASWRSGSHDTTCWALDVEGDKLPPI